MVLVLFVDERYNGYASYTIVDYDLNYSSRVRRHKIFRLDNVNLYQMILSASLIVGSLADTVHAGSLFLFGEDDAQQLRLSEQELIDLRPTLTRKLVLGPRIQIKKPSIQDKAGGDTIVTPTPMDLLVEFVETSAPVDMESLEVKVKKGWFSKSLTDKLKPYVKGTTIEANDLEVPEGRYLIEFYVADSNGAETTATYGLEVVRQ